MYICKQEVALKFSMVIPYFFFQSLIFNFSFYSGADINPINNIFVRYLNFF